MNQRKIDDSKHNNVKTEKTEKQAYLKNNENYNKKSEKKLLKQQVNNE